jgi:hypothetical protein
MHFSSILVFAYITAGALGLALPVEPALDIVKVSVNP